jgi:hypothetical protein
MLLGIRGARDALDASSPDLLLLLMLQLALFLQLGTLHLLCRRFSSATPARFCCTWQRRPACWCSRRPAHCRTCSARLAGTAAACHPRPPCTRVQRIRPPFKPPLCLLWLAGAPARPRLTDCWARPAAAAAAAAACCCCPRAHGASVAAGQHRWPAPRQVRGPAAGRCSSL